MKDFYQEVTNKIVAAIEAGTLQALVPEAEWTARPLALRDDALAQVHAHDLGRELFAGLRRNVNSAEQGACTWL